MGYEADCTLRHEGRTARGKARLETTDIIFRGPFRLAVPLKDITTATAHDGRLVVEFGGRTAEFDVGPAAPKWASRISNPPSRLDKLGVAPGTVVVTVAVDDRDFLDEMEARGAHVGETASPASADLLFYGASRRAVLNRLPALSRRIKPNGAIWVIRPKGDPAISEADVMAAGKAAGLVDVKVVSFSPTHTAEKFVIPVARRPAGDRRAATDGRRAAVKRTA